MSELPNVTRNDDGSLSLVWSTDKQTAISISRELLEHVVGEINDGRRAALTEAEREAVTLAAGAMLERFVLSGDGNDRQIAATLRGLLDRIDATGSE